MEWLVRSTVGIEDKKEGGTAVAGERDGMDGIESVFFW